MSHQFNPFIPSDNYAPAWCIVSASGCFESLPKKWGQP